MKERLPVFFHALAKPWSSFQRIARQLLIAEFQPRDLVVIE
ncbi:MAG: hypothetical protein OXH52_09365 [Gammaproteobacteria bacterium]|nr:hypothetical protein [Gammaproteobacteria bacterium]